MKIRSIKISQNQIKKKKQDTTELLSNYKPINIPGNSISFGYSISFNRKQGLRCFSCGKKMMTNKMFRNFLKRVSLAKNTAEILDIISSYTKFLHQPEKECLNLLKSANNANPDANVEELLIQLKPECLKKLEKKQISVFTEIDKLSENLSPDQAQELKKLNADAKEIILLREPTSPFKRKDWINSILNFTLELSDKNLTEQIFKTAKTFPSSSTDVDAFVIKYSIKPPEKIINRFLSESIISTDHIIPRIADGKSHWDNYVPKCRICNSSEGRDYLHKRAQYYPEMSKEAQRALDRIIGLINAGHPAMKGYYKYPKIIANTFRQESKVPGTDEPLIKLDISKLQPQYRIIARRLQHKLVIILQYVRKKFTCEPLFSYPKTQK